ncbi:tetratricopeptide repeat protein 12 isoform X2 [Hydra vulgaris]|uniref:Tetratricopeptide repeat protein 12 isoform X2 n=1 Tax=Hydra vulgaris TaxID=6087 RepID=A0ABM4B688_HYDVU
MATADEKELQMFLDKVDMVGSVIKNLNCDDKTVQEEAFKIADKYLEKNTEKTCVDRSIINKQQDVSDSIMTFDKPEMSQEEFICSMEKDIEERNLRKARNTENALIWKEKGNKHFVQNENTDAVRCYSEAIQLVPDNIVHYTNRAQAYLKLKQYGEALNDCDTALKLDKRSVKALVLKGRTLGSLKNFDQALTIFNKVLAIDPKQTKMINNYIDETRALQQLNIDEEKTLSLYSNDEDDNAKKIHNNINRLRKGCQSDLQQIISVLCDLKDAVKTNELRTLFRIRNGFNIINENATLRKILTSCNSLSKDEVEIAVILVELFSSTSLDNAYNSELICQQEVILNTVSFFLQTESTLRSVFESVQFIYRLSQFPKTRTRIVKLNSFQSIFDNLLRIINDGGDVAIIATGSLNNFALEASFLVKFQERLLQSFIPNVINMMVLLYSSHDKQSAKVFPMIASSISTISNIFREKHLRLLYNNDMHIWKVTLSLIKVYMKSEDSHELRVVEACVGMLMNLSASSASFSKDVVFQVSEMLPNLLVCKSEKVVERICGTLSHVLDKNTLLLENIINTNIYKIFFQLIKGSYTDVQKHLIKCLVILTNQNDSVVQNIYSEKVLKILLRFLLLDDCTVVGNTALCLSHCSKNKNIVSSLIHTTIIKDLLIGATNDTFPKNARHNCALAIGKYAIADQRYLEQLRTLHGMEILHQVIKENNLV